MFGIRPYLQVRKVNRAGHLNVGGARQEFTSYEFNWQQMPAWDFQTPEILAAVTKFAEIYAHPEFPVYNLGDNRGRQMVLIMHPDEVKATCALFFDIPCEFDF